MERPIGGAAAVMSVLTRPVAISTARIDRPTWKTTSRSLTVSSGLAASATGADPIGRPLDGEYQASRSPSGVRSSAASTCAARAIATGVPCGWTLETT
jgi:hypothetical protein